MLDMTVAEDLSLLEAQQEFLQRYQNQQTDPSSKQLPMLASSCPGKNITRIFMNYLSITAPYLKKRIIMTADNEISVQLKV